MTTVIIGAGGHAREALDILRESGEEPAGFLVEEGFGDRGTLIHGAEILGTLEWIQGQPHARAVCAVGDPALRRRLAIVAGQFGAQFVSAVHPSAHRTSWLSIGKGVLIAAGTTMTNEIRLGDHVHINVGCTVSHDVSLGDYVTLSPGVHIGGGVIIDEGAFLGIGAVVLPKVRIGPWSIIGAGAVVTADLPENVTAVGVPARVVKVRDTGWHLES